GRRAQQLLQRPALGIEGVALRLQLRELGYAAARLLRQADDVLDHAEPLQAVLRRLQLPRQLRRLVAQEGPRAPGLSLLRLLAVDDETGRQQIGHSLDQLRIGSPIAHVHDVGLSVPALDRERLSETPYRVV